MKILFVAGDPKPERWIEPLRTLLPEADIRAWDPDAPAWNAHYAIVWKPPASLFEKEKNLRAIFNLGAGVDGLIAIPGLPRNIPVVRLEDAGMAVQMAEYVAHQLIDASRGMDVYREQQRQGQWKLNRPISRAEWPVGIMGLGQIGARVARTLAALDYPVNGWARSRHDIEGVTGFQGDAGFGEFLGASRVLVNTLPLTEATRGIINRDTLARLQPDAVVINVGRGEHLVEQDLLDAVDAGHVSRASLDVFTREPLPPEHPFWSRPEITITPHMSARSLRQASIEQIAAKIRAHAGGGEISGIVDISQGY